MYEPDGNEFLVKIKREKGGTHILSVDLEGYAGFLNQGIAILEEREIIRPPLEDVGESDDLLQQ